MSPLLSHTGWPASFPKLKEQDILGVTGEKITPFRTNNRTAGIMQIEIRAIGRIREEYIAAGIDEYRKRLRPYVRVSIREFPEGHIQDEHSPSLCQQVREREGGLLLKGIPESMVIIALDAGGESWSSTDLAHRMAAWELTGTSGVAFLVGGPLGLHEAVFARSDHQLSLSRMTFPHQLVRLILAEQLYRAFRIMRGEPYHK